MSIPRISIRYRRLPDEVTVFDQLLVEDAGEHVVTLLEASPIEKPLRIHGRIVLEPGAPIVWFTYRGLWYDVGRFHLADGTFTGVYANVVTPVRMQENRWETTDLCLDVWKGTDDTVVVLDEEELTEAVEQRWVDRVTASAARETAETLALLARQGEWPPAHVDDWTIEKVRDRLGLGQRASRRAE